MSESHIAPESLPPPRSPRWLFVGSIAGIIAVALILFASDGPTLLKIIRNIGPWTLVWPLATTAASYASMARSYQKIAAAAGLHLSFGEISRLTLVSTAANYLLSTGGLSGLAVRSYYFSQQHRLRWGSAVSISLAQTFITNLVLFAFLCWGVLNVVFYRDVSGRSLVGVFILFLLAFSLCLAALAVVAYRRARLKLFAGLIRLADLLSRLFVGQRATLRARLALFEEELHEGVDFLIARRSQMLSPVLWVCLDWFLMLATLYVSFRCVHETVPMHIVVIGFSTGILLSTVNLVPGGLGLMEGSMAAVFAGLGVPLEPAVIATLIFRFTYYVVPLVTSLAFFRGMLRTMSPARIPEPTPKRSLA